VTIRCDIRRGIKGEPVEAIGIIQDITEQTAASAERDRLASAIEQINEMVVILDLDRTICYVNPAFERITGYSRDEALGKSADILKSGAHTEQFYAAVWETLHRGDSWFGRFINRKKDGTLYTDETTISPILDSRGRVTNYVEIKRDITAELEMRERLTQSDKEESLGRLAGGIAHDLNNLLSPILGYSEILSTRDEIPAALIKMIQNIHQAGIKSRNLVRQLLAFSRKQALNFMALDLEKTVKDFEPFLKRVIREDVVIRIDSQPALPPVRADKGQIEQVLMNLAVNAQDAMPDGGTLSITLEKTTVGPYPKTGTHEADPGNYIKLCFRDTGTGMDEDTRKRIFEPFFSTKGAQGTGLGLATVYGIIKQHAGSISLETFPGQGTIFTILLPVAEETTPKSADSVSRASAMERGCETVLVAEDSSQVLELTRTILEQSGYTVFTAPSGEDALKLLKEEKNQIDLLLTDVIMPEMNGPELFRQALEICPGLKVLYMSGYTGNAILQHGFSEKEVHLIQKPFTLASLTHKVREVLDSR
jgi:PAS domain S-box-containing protein